MYRTLNVSQRPSHIISSEHRTKRILEFEPPATVQDVLKILGDTKDPDYPLYRTPRKTDESSTIATGIITVYSKISITRSSRDQ